MPAGARSRAGMGTQEACLARRNDRLGLIASAGKMAAWAGIGHCDPQEVPLKVQGQCHCGAIEYEAQVQPGTITVCHCTDCQTQSGSVFRANIPAPANTFRLVKGTPRTYIKTAASGSKRVLAFCEVCGSPLYACAAENPQAYSLRIGTLKQRHELGAPQRQIWTQRCLSWVAFAAELEAFDGQP